MNISFEGLVFLVCFVTYNGFTVNRLEHLGRRGASFRLAVETALDVAVMVMGEKYIWVGAEILGLIISNMAPSLKQKRVLQNLNPNLVPLYRAGTVLVSGIIWGTFQYIR